MTPYGVTDIDQYIRRRQAITKTNSDLLSVGPTRTLFCAQLKREHIFPQDSHTKGQQCWNISVE